MRVRREALKRLLDALQAIQAVEAFTAGKTLEAFLDDDLLQAGVERKFEVIGEALKCAHAADPDVLELVPELPRIVSTRNRIIHVYEGVDHVILWDAIQNELPSLKIRLQSALEVNQP